jgi:chemotaxis protein MotB
MEEECPKCPSGLPPWLATFADLMSLLMCFFVLLLSFAEIDAVRFKKMADALKDAFGVQREIPASEIVKGVSVIKQEFSPSTIPEPSPINEIRQHTTDESQEDLKVNEAMKQAVEEQLKQEVAQQSQDLRAALEEEIREGLVEVETDYPRIIVRIQEKGSFPSGSADLDPEFFQVMAKISEKLAGVPGSIVVAGHTDNVPIATRRFRSNWELSAARAVTVTHALLSNPAVDPARVVVQGLAESNPLAPNDNAENRARNRRVELILQRGPADQEAGTLAPGAVPSPVPGPAPRG